MLIVPPWVASASAPQEVLPTAPHGLVLIQSRPSTWGWHKVSEWMHCRRWAAFRAEGRSFARSNALQIGGLVSTYLAHQRALDGLKYGAVHVGQYGLLQSTDRARVMDPVLAVETLAGLTGVAEKNVDAAIEAATASHRGSPIPGRILGVEMNLKRSLAPDLPEFEGNLDLVYQTDSGEIVISDDKSTSVYTDRTAEEYDYSGQFAGYAWLAEAHWPGRKIRVIVRLVEKPKDDKDAKLRSRVHPIPILPQHLVEFPQVAAEVMREILAVTAQAGSDPFNYRPRWSGGSGQGCIGKYYAGGRCPAWFVCSGGRNSLPEQATRPSGAVYNPMARGLASC